MGISFESIILILVLALILFGPEKLPELAEKIGKWVAKLRQASTDLTQHYHQVVNPLSLPLTSQETFCPHCSQKLDQDYHFCPSCGRNREDFPPAPTPSPEPFPSITPVTHCPICTRKMEEDFLFCPTCGHHRDRVNHYSAHETPHPPKLVTCLQCARQLASDFLFCPSCGYPLEKTPEPPKSLAHQS